MGTVLSALVVVGVLAVSGVLLVQLFVSESRRSKDAGKPARVPAASPAVPVRKVAPAPQPIPVRTASSDHPSLPERAVPPPPAPRPRRVRRPAPAAVRQAQPAVSAPVVSAPVLSPDGAWLWTGSAWVPAWWGGPTVPPPPPYATAAPPRRDRSSGCLATLGMGCAVVFGIAALIVLLVVATAGGLGSLTGG